jgi:hypothetical protein
MFYDEQERGRMKQEITQFGTRRSNVTKLYVNIHMVFFDRNGKHFVHDERGPC